MKTSFRIICWIVTAVLMVFHSCIIYGQDSLNAPSRLPLDLLFKHVDKRSIGEVLDFSVSITDRISEQMSSQAPATISIITEEQIALRGYQSLLDVLRDVHSVKIDYGVDPRWMNDVSLRGIRGMNNFIILLDGVRISSPTNEIIPIMENYPIHFAKQIEIVFGPASALYGADAFSGVINIVSKTPPEIINTEFSIYGGMYNTITGNILMSESFGKAIDLTIAGQYFYDQQPQLSKYYPEEYEDGLQSLQSGTFNTALGAITPLVPVSPEESQTPLSTYGIMAQLSVKDFSFTYFGNRSVNPSIMANSPENAVYNQGAFFGHSVNTMSGVYQKELGSVNLSSYAIGSYYKLDPESNFRNAFTALNSAYLYSRGWMWKGEQLVSWKPNQKISLTTGITFEKFFSIPRGHDLQYPVLSKDPPPVPIVNSIAENNPEGIEVELPRIRFDNFGVLSQLRYDPSSSLSLTLGARYDNNTRFAGTFNPRLGIVWQTAKNITLKALIGTAFLAPSPQAAFDQFGTFSTEDEGLTYRSSFFRLPNPDLGPKKIQTGELSLTTNLFKDVRIQLNTFYSRIDGLFSFVPDKGNTDRYDGTFRGWPVDFIEVTINQGNQVNFGGSLVVDYIKQLSQRSKISTYLSLSVVDGHLAPEQEGIGRAELPSITPLILKFGGDFIYRRFSISPRFIITGRQLTFSPKLDDPTKRQKLDGYSLVNIDVNYRLLNRLVLHMGIENLLDIRYRNVNLGAAPDGAFDGAAQLEFANGAPQNPIRIIGGINFKI